MNAIAATARDASEELVVLPGSTTPCQQRLDSKRVWGRTLAVRTGSLVLGVRGDTADSADLLDEVLAPLRDPRFDDAVAPNFSVEIGVADTPRRLFLAYRAHQVVARRHDRGDLVRDLLELLDDGPKTRADDSLALLAGALVTPDRRVVLLPGDVHRTLLSRRRQLEREGVRLLAGRTQCYDLRDGSIDTRVVDDSVRKAVLGLGGPATHDERLPVHTWCVGAAAPAAVRLSGADAVMASLGQVLNRERLGMGATLRGVRDVAVRHPVVAMPTLSAGAQAREVLALLR